MKLKNKIALITGASRGIGAAVSERFAAEGAHIIAVARSQRNLEKLDDKIKSIGGKVTLVPIDISDWNAVDRMSSEISKRFGKIDILVGNAAILGQLSPMSHYTPEMWKNIFDINFHANWRLIRNLELLLKQSSHGRAIFVTSGVASKVRAFWGPYAASKAALEKMVKDWSLEIEKTNIRANIINPGKINTSMRRQAYPGEDQTKNLEAKDVSKYFVDLAIDNCNFNGKIIEVNI